jgi:hypothetical protein
MGAINVLVVGDGPFMNNSPPVDGINFAPTQDLTDDTFTVSEFLYILQNSTAPAISVETAHRRNDPNADHPNFVFTPAGIAKYDVLWLFGYEGWNYQATPPGGPLSDSEIAAIRDFMDAGGGVFATGDHAGMGSYMCGGIPRVRTMRKWFARSQDLPPGYPTTAVNYAGASVTSLNWPGVSGNPTPVGRADTLVMNPSDAPDNWQFDDQSDDIPQLLTFPNGFVHPILRGSNGPLSQFPDHMHEGEVVVPGDPGAVMTIGGQTYTEYPTLGGFQPVPSVLSTGTVTGGHATTVEGSACEQDNFTTDTTPTVQGTIGISCAYDGYAANIGRIVTDSSFHHYLDLNLVGDPCGSSPDRMAGFGSAKTQPAAGSVLDDLRTFYLNTVTWLAKPNRNFYFAVDKSSFGYDEAYGGGSFPQFANCFWLVVDGYSTGQVQSAINANQVTLSGPFANISGISIQRGSSLVTQGQRVLIPYSVQFAGGSMGAFPQAGQQPVEMLLQGTITIGGNSYLAETTIELVAGADPYFQNVNPAEHNVFYLSQDLCVFSAAPGSSPTQPIPGIPESFKTANHGAQDTAAAQDFIGGVLNYMNSHSQFTDIGNGNPFAGFPTTTAASGDSSVNPTVNGNVNYNFAVARVRLNGPSGTSASPVRVFFRLFLTQTNDTDYQPATSYASHTDAAGLPDWPLTAPDGSSTPFFATGSASGDYTGANPVNVQTITTDATGGLSKYFGCFLDVYSGAWNWQARGSHHCLVAQIAYDDAPIVNANGITEGPDNCDKLAQRNLQITPSGNPTGPAGHRIPQTFEVRPSPPVSTTPGTLLDYPDELVIDWGNTPVGSTAMIYWPQVAGIDVVRLASRLYGTEEWSLLDPHTMTCTVKGGASCLPIPSGGTERLPGLFTVDLPAGVKAGQEFDIVVRRFSSRQPPLEITVQARRAGAPEATVPRKVQTNWRYVVGTFQVKIPVAYEDALLLAEENTYSIMKWRLGLLSPTDRWYPVLQRYVAYLAGRVEAFGGNPVTILPSPTGVPYPIPGQGGGGGQGEADEFTGKVEGLIYDRFGDFEGFLLRTEHGHEHRFEAQEKETEELVRCAWEDRMVISVRVKPGHKHEPVSIILRRAPRWRE